MAIKHAPKTYVRYAINKAIFPDNFTIYPGSIYGRYTVNNSPIFWVCDQYYLVKGKLPVHIYNGIYWEIHLISKNHPCYQWVLKVIRDLGKIPKIQHESLEFNDYKEMMKTYSRHKKGVGSRINTRQINQPLKWNEVTEYAHWYGKGNASIVANSIR